MRLLERVLGLGLNTMSSRSYGVDNASSSMTNSLQDIGMVNATSVAPTSPSVLNALKACIPPGAVPDADRPTATQRAEVQALLEDDITLYNELDRRLTRQLAAARLQHYV